MSKFLFFLFFFFFKYSLPNLYGDNHHHHLLWKWPNNQTLTHDDFKIGFLLFLLFLFVLSVISSLWWFLWWNFWMCCLDLIWLFPHLCKFQSLVHHSAHHQIQFADLTSHWTVLVDSFDDHLIHHDCLWMVGFLWISFSPLFLC